MDYEVSVFKGVPDSEGIEELEQVVQNAGIVTIGNVSESVQHENVHRSIELSKRGRQSIYGPFFLDVDAEPIYFESDGNTPTDDAILRAREISLGVLDLYKSEGVADEDIRVFFTGHKGFHIELIHQNMNDMHFGGEYIDARWRAEKARVQELLKIDEQSLALIDIPKPMRRKRLNGSVNVWTGIQGVRRHKVTHVTDKVIANISPTDLWTLSQVESEG